MPEPSGPHVALLLRLSHEVQRLEAAAPVDDGEAAALVHRHLTCSRREGDAFKQHQQEHGIFVGPRTV